MSRQPVSLGCVQETLLIPLYARAVDSRRQDSLLRDSGAVAMVEAIAYDFRRFQDPSLLAGAVLRTAIVDDIVRRFMAAHHGATVVEVGAGLSTRSERLDNGRVRWVDVDLPDAIALRRRFVRDTTRRITIAASVLDEEWAAVVPRTKGRYLIVAEAVLMYFAEADVKAVLARIAAAFPGLLVVFDSARPALLAAVAGRVASGIRARLQWGCEDPRDIEAWMPDCRLRESWSLANLPAAVRHRLPAAYRSALAIAVVLGRDDVHGYRVNVFEVGR